MPDSLSLSSSLSSSFSSCSGGGGPALGEPVAHDLERWIVRAGLAAGDRLPSEKLLCERFGVSRAVIREAIARLKAEGVITTRQGAGAFIAALPGRSSFRFDRLQQASHDERHAAMAQMFELRYLIERGAAELAAMRRTPADLQRMQAALERMERALVRRTDAAIDDDLFHVAVAEASHNPQLARFLAYMGRQLSDTRVPTWSRTGHAAGWARVAHEEHCRLYSAIERGDAGQARRLAEAHILDAAQRLGLPALPWLAGGSETGNMAGNMAGGASGYGAAALSFDMEQTRGEQSDG